jgi:hypothetical protein
MQRLDDVVSRLPRQLQDIDLLWVDVQGHEMHLLQGADQVLSAGMPVVCEFWPYGLARAGASFQDYYDYIRRRFRFFYDLNDEVPQRQSSVELLRLFERYQGLQHSDLLLTSV